MTETILAVGGVLFTFFLITCILISKHVYKKAYEAGSFTGYSKGWEAGTSLAVDEALTREEAREEAREETGEPMVPQSLVNQILKDTKAGFKKEIELAVDAARSSCEKKFSAREKSIREDAVARSKNVIKGKTTEHLLPYFDDFQYNPSDCRFLGSPIDMLIFDGLSDGDVKEVVFLEIKTGPSANLSSRERKVRDAIVAGRVSWRLIRKNDD